MLPKNTLPPYFPAKASSLFRQKREKQKNKEKTPNEGAADGKGAVFRGQTAFSDSSEKSLTRFLTRLDMVMAKKCYDK